MIDRLQPFVAQCRQEIDPRGLERRRQAEHDARDLRQHDRKGEHAVVHRQIHAEGEVDPLQRAHAPPRQDAAGDAARQ